MTQQTPISYIAKHTFTPEEKEQKLQQMLNAMRIKAEIEDELKTTKSTYKAKIDSRDAEIKLMSNLLNAGQEDRTFQVIVTMDFETGKKRYTEVGTNRVIAEEALTAEDHQMQLELTEKSIAENNKAADQLQLVIDEKVEEAENIRTQPTEQDEKGGMKNSESSNLIEPIQEGGIEASEPEDVKEDDEFDFGDDTESDEPF